MVRHYTIIIPLHLSVTMGAKVWPLRLPEWGSSAGSPDPAGSTHVQPKRVTSHPDSHHALLSRSAGVLLSFEFTHNFPLRQRLRNSAQGCRDIPIYRRRRSSLPRRYNANCYLSMHRYSYGQRNAGLSPVLNDCSSLRA